MKAYLLGGQAERNHETCDVAYPPSSHLIWEDWARGADVSVQEMYRLATPVLKSHEGYVVLYVRDVAPVANPKVIEIRMLSADRHALNQTINGAPSTMPVRIDFGIRSIADVGVWPEIFIADIPLPNVDVYIDDVLRARARWAEPGPITLDSGQHLVPAFAGLDHGGAVWEVPSPEAKIHCKELPPHTGLRVSVVKDS